MGKVAKCPTCKRVIEWAILRPNKAGGAGQSVMVEADGTVKVVVKGKVVEGPLLHYPCPAPMNRRKGDDDQPAVATEEEKTGKQFGDAWRGKG